jgi:hypothetical protein
MRRRVLLSLAPTLACAQSTLWRARMAAFKLKPSN